MNQSSDDVDAGTATSALLKPDTGGHDDFAGRLAEARHDPVDPVRHYRTTPEAVMQVRLLLRWTSKRVAGSRCAIVCGRMHSSRPGLAEPDPDTSYVAVGIAGTGPVGTIALKERGRRAAPRNRPAELGACGSRPNWRCCLLTGPSGTRQLPPDRDDQWLIPLRALRSRSNLVLPKRERFRAGTTAKPASGASAATSHGAHAFGVSGASGDQSSAALPACVSPGLPGGFTTIRVGTTSSGASRPRLCGPII